MKKFLEDVKDLNNLKKCPNDFPFWYFMLLHIYIMLPIYISFILGFLMGGKYVG